MLTDISAITVAKAALPAEKLIKQPVGYDNELANVIVITVPDTKIPVPEFRVIFPAMLEPATEEVAPEPAAAPRANVGVLLELIIAVGTDKISVG